MLTRRGLRLVARWLMPVVVWAQLAVAAYACHDIAALAAPAEMAMAMDGPCDDPLGLRDAAASALCAEHCKVGQQSDQVPNLPVPVAAPAASYPLVSIVAVPPPRRASGPTVDALVANAPPHAIAHCVRRT